MLPSKRSDLTISVLKKLRKQGMPSKVGLVSDMSEEGPEAGQEMEEIVQSKTNVLPKNPRKKRPSES